MLDTYQAEQVEIDTLVKMIKMAYAFENWDKVLSLSTNLLEAAGSIRKIHAENRNLYLRMDRHIAYYFGYSYLMKGLAYQKLKQYAKSLECVAGYSDLRWLDDSTEAGITVIRDFSIFARANTLTLQILQGRRDRLPEYVLFLETNPEQVLSGLITILESALSYHYGVDDELQFFMKYVQNYNTDDDPVIASNYLTFSYMLAMYRYKSRSYSDALNSVITNLELSDRLRNDSYFKRSVALFETLRIYASAHQLERYSKLLTNILKGEIEHEEGVDCGGCTIRSNHY